MVISNFLLGAAFLLLPLIYFKRRKLDTVKELGLEKAKASSAWKYSLITLGAMALVSFVLALIFNYFGINDISKVSEALQAAKESGLYFAYTLTIGVILEEFFFRGFLVRFFERMLLEGKKAKGILQENSGILASSVVFGLMHFLYGSFAEVFGAVCLGIVLAFFWKKYKNLYANVYAHLLWNAIVLVAGAMI